MELIEFNGVDNYYAGIPYFFRFNKSATGDPYYAMAGFSGTFETFIFKISIMFQTS